MFIILVLQLFFRYVEALPTHSKRQNANGLSEDLDGGIRCPRGISGILTPCILTLFLCIWTTIHTNIEPDLWRDTKTIQLKRQPTSGISKPLTPEDTRRSWLSRLRTMVNPNKVAWSIVTLLFPEIALLVAAHERKTAYLLLKGIEKAAKDHHWDITVCYYAIMGGFVVEEFPNAPRAEDESPTTSLVKDVEVGVEGSIMSSTVKDIETGVDAIQHHDKPDSIQHGVENVMYHGPLRSDERKNLTKRCTLTPQGVVYLASLQPSALPDCPPEVVQDKNKASLLTKFLVCFQAMWMFIQVVARWASEPYYGVTLIELYTVLHVFCAMAMYITWFQKPMNIQQPTFIQLPPNTLRNLMVPPEAASFSPVDVFTHTEHKAVRLTTRAGLGKLFFRQLGDLRKAEGINGKVLLVRRAYEAIWNGWSTFALEAGILSLIGILHGGLHLVALVGDDFLTPPEKVVWLLSSSLTAVAVAIFCASVLVGHLFKAIFRKTEESQNKIIAHFTDSCMTIYCYCFIFSVVPTALARFYLFGESFAALRVIGPAEQRRMQWAELIPHVGG